MSNKLYFGDNLGVLRSKAIPAESVDLVYLDPPFNSNANYNVLFRSPAGERSRAQIQAFEDTWHWTEEAELAYSDVLESGTSAAGILRSLRSFLGENDMMAYLAMMAVRLIELRKVMKPTASLYLHCDPTASHYLKILLDGIFGAQNFRNEIVWLRSKNPHGSQHANRRYSPHTDSLLYYGKSADAPFYAEEIRIPLSPQELEEKYDRTDEHGRYADGPILRSASMGPRPNLVYAYKGFTPGAYGWRLERDKLEEIDAAGNLSWSASGAPRRKLRPADDRGDPVGNYWGDIAPVNSQAEERVGYPTQKPLSLLERIITASSKRWDTILDPFCGCGTAIHAAQRLERQWIGIDITHIAIQIIEDRLRKHFPMIKPKVIGRPADLAGAQDLARRDKHEFQSWAVWLAGGWPVGGVEKKGMDRGVDGEFFFRISAETDARAIISVKGGQHIGPQMVRDLKGTREREDAEIAVFVSLEEPSAEMRREAATGKFFEGPGERIPRIQLFTIGELLSGVSPRRPPVYDTSTVMVAGRRAGRVRKPKELTPEELQRSPKLPLDEGHSRDKQQPLPLADDLLVKPPAPSKSKGIRKRKKKAS
jgi:site-specific DNA-methyltransferase (adenine-specific)